MIINSLQRKILLSCGIIICAMLLFPPFVTKLPNGAQSNEGFSFLFFPPKGGWSITPSVNATQLIAQWLAVCLIGGISFFLSGILTQDKSTQTSVTQESPDPRENPWLKLMGPVLRIGRGILVLWAVFIGIALLNSLFQMLTMSSASSDAIDWGKHWAFLLVKVAGIAILMIASRVLSAAINLIYRNHFGRTNNVIDRWRDL